jgi:hypothetical protein
MAVTQPDKREQIWDFVREVLMTRGNNSTKTEREKIIFIEGFFKGASVIHAFINAKTPEHADAADGLRKRTTTNIKKCLQLDHLRVREATEQKTGLLTVA